MEEDLLLGTFWQILASLSRFRSTGILNTDSVLKLDCVLMKNLV